MFCQYCGEEIQANQKFCINCGAEVPKVTNSSSDFSKSSSGNTESSKNETSGEGNKGLAIISYLSWVGFIVALILNNEQKDELTKFHLNQALIINLISLLGLIPRIGSIFKLFYIILFILGVVYAAQGQKKELPVVGSIKLI